MDDFPNNLNHCIYEKNKKTIESPFKGCITIFNLNEDRLVKFFYLAFQSANQTNTILTNKHSLILSNFWEKIKIFGFLVPFEH